MPQHSELQDLDDNINCADPIDEIIFHKGEYLGGMASVILAIVNPKDIPQSFSPTNMPSYIKKVINKHGSVLVDNFPVEGMARDLNVAFQLLTYKDGVEEINIVSANYHTHSATDPKITNHLDEDDLNNFQMEIMGAIETQILDNLDNIKLESDLDSVHELPSA